MKPKSNKIQIASFDDTTVVGINSALADYKLAWNINNKLLLDLVRYDDLIFEGNPFSIEGFTLRAELKKQMGDQQGAEEDLARLREINPDGNDEDLEQKMNEAYKNSNPMGL